MIFRQFLHEDLGCASYVVGDLDEGVAAGGAPRRSIGESLALPRYLDVRIEHVLETHTHADHVSGHGRLAAATGAAIHIHRLATPDYEHEPFEDRWAREQSESALCMSRAPVPSTPPSSSSTATAAPSRGPC